MLRNSKPTSQYQVLKGLEATCKVPGALGLPRSYSLGHFQGHEWHVFRVGGSSDSSPGLWSLVQTDPAVAHV